MSEPFLIFALPRSRTAWLANFLNYGAVECGHELTSGLCQDGLRQHLTGSAKAYAGNSDTGQALIANELLDLLPSARVVVVYRDERDVCASLSRIGLPVTPHMLAAHQNALDQLSRRAGTLTVDFEDLAAESAARAILAHVAPAEPFNRYRWQTLQGFNVQITRDRIQQLVRLAEKNITH